jgi:acid stress chaperone HdeB
MQSIVRNLGGALALAALSAAGPGTISAHAQTTIDVSKITCEQFLSFKVADPRDISIWLSGFFHGRQGATQLELQQLNDNFSKLKSECFSLANTKRTVLELAEEMFRAK